MPPRPRTDTIRFLTLDELGCLLAATRGSVRDRAMFLLAYRHGLRASEVGLLHAEDHELSMLSLHLLQNCMVFVNTLMLQQALSRPDWAAERLTARDRHALTPLFWEHVNPYGRQELDMLTRIAALA